MIGPRPPLGQRKQRRIKLVRVGSKRHRRWVGKTPLNGVLRNQRGFGLLVGWLKVAGVTMLCVYSIIDGGGHAGHRDKKKRN